MNDEERKLTEKGIKNNEKLLTELESELAYNKSVVKLQKIQREFDNYWRHYKQNKKDGDDNRIIKSMEDEIKLKKETIEINKKQLEEK